MTGESQYFHATLPWADTGERNRSWFRGLPADDPRIVWCTQHCTLPWGACDRHEACPFYWERGHGDNQIPAGVALERCKRLIEEAERARCSDGRL